ncbi:hypothetical protein RFI_07942 [Reticulomyxa filosa]|uniref:Uncharacterized protein n=1 Tax=Reticulomyxa filosa TaxID=46433 RepID=X6NTS8_RETFI|nr:hypothetical protein RFI_07942 [Reticulomyxa filosa]|eukprot:ETO29184.1 hypothetical protein RFI_07942 [Reticulomyxa filosa]
MSEPEETEKVHLQEWFNGLNEATQHVLITKALEEDSLEFNSLVEMMLKHKTYDKEQIPTFRIFVKSLKSLTEDMPNKKEEKEAKQDNTAKAGGSIKSPTTTTALKTSDTAKAETNKKASDKKIPSTNTSTRSKSQGAALSSRGRDESIKCTKRIERTDYKGEDVVCVCVCMFKVIENTYTLEDIFYTYEYEYTYFKKKKKAKSKGEVLARTSKDKKEGDTTTTTATTTATSAPKKSTTSATATATATSASASASASRPSTTTKVGRDNSADSNKKTSGNDKGETEGTKDKTTEKKSSSWSPAPWYKQNLTEKLSDFWEEKEASHMRGKWNHDVDRLKTTPKVATAVMRFSPSPDRSRYAGLQRTYHGKGRKRPRKNVPKPKNIKFRALQRATDYGGGEGGQHQRIEGTGGEGGQHSGTTGAGGGEGADPNAGNKVSGTGGNGGVDEKKSGTGGDEGEHKKISKKAKFKKKLAINEAVRAAERNEDAIAVNLDNMRNKPDFDKMITYNINWLANLANNPFNVDYIIQQGAIDTIAEIMKHHKNNPAIMKDVARLLDCIAKSKPEHADLVLHSSIIDQCLATLRDFPNECGIYALDILDSILDGCSDPHQMVDILVDKNALPILCDALDEFGEENSKLAAAITKHLTKQAKWKPETMDWMGENELFLPILRAMREHPDNEELVVMNNNNNNNNDIALRNNKYLQAMKDKDVVPIICGVMSETPESERLQQAGVRALKVFADRDDLLDALKVVFNFDKFDYPILNEGLIIVGNLVLLPEHADFVTSKGGVNVLLNCITAKDNAANQSFEDLDIIAKATRTLGRLLGNEESARNFSNARGLDHFEHLVDKYSDEEPILNAVMEALEYLVKTPNGQEQILESGILTLVTEVLAVVCISFFFFLKKKKNLLFICIENPEYNIMFRRYAKLMGYLPLDNQEFLGGLIDAGMLNCITDNLTHHMDKRNDVMASSDLICDLATLHPSLSGQLAEADASPLIAAMKTHQNDAETMKHIFDAIEALVAGDPSLRELFEKAGMDFELDKMLKSENTSLQMKEMIQEFLDRLNALKAKPAEPEENRRDQLLRELKELYDQLDDLQFAEQFIQEGKVVGVLDGIQEYYDDAEIVEWGLKDLAKIARVPNSFPTIEEAGLAEAVVQCMLEHPGVIEVQLEGFKVFSGLAQQNDNNIPDILMQPITLDTLLKGVEDNIISSIFVGEFCNIVEGLLKSNPNDAYNVASALQAEGVTEVLEDALDIHKQQTPQLVPRIEEVLGYLKHLLTPIDAKMNVDMDLEPYGTAVLTMAQLGNLDEEELIKLMSSWDTDQLMKTMREAKDPMLVQWSVNEVNRRLNGGDQDVHTAMVGGGIDALLDQAHAHFDNEGPLGAALDTLGTLANEERLKPMLGMIGLIQLILETMRAHPHDIELLDRCCYLLSLLTYNNEDNINQVIELSGIADILNVIKRHNVVNFLCGSALLVLVNLCHRSDKNKVLNCICLFVLICRSGGAKVSIDCLVQYSHCRTTDDENVVVAALRCLANFGFVEENLKQLIKLNTVHLIMDTMQRNTDKTALIQMGVVTLANLSSHERAVRILVSLGVMDLAINVSKGYPDEIEIQKSCLGCIGNLVSEPANVVLFMDKSGHLRLYEIMRDLLFEEPVVVLCLKLLKILAVSSDAANKLCSSGGCGVVTQLLNDNINNTSIIMLGCQALCRMIVTKETAKEMYSQGISIDTSF